MCGILGWINPALIEPLAAKKSADRALTALQSRGPDDRRMEWGPGWILGATRLAVIDLSSRASQPMTDGRGRWLVYNGEIYNFRELRAELEARGCRFHSDGDTEVLLQALTHWGIGCLERLRGMFAFGWLDTEHQELILARDRYGVKPLAYEVRGPELRFASDLFALRALPRGSLEVDPEAAYLYMALGYVPAPHSIHRGVRKVRPGHYLRVCWSEAGLTDVVEQPYWSVRSFQPNGDAGHVPRACPQNGEGDLLAEYERRASEAVRYRLISDVPVGILFSGGIDSTLVTVLSRELAGSVVPLFTMGFDESAYDERPFARSIARRLGGNHLDFQMTDAAIQDAWSGLWRVYDEPFADSSAIPMLVLARHVATRVKVALSGDGGDEVFCGYPWHQTLYQFDTGWAPRRREWMRKRRIAGFRLQHGIPPDVAVDRAAYWSILRTGLSDEMARRLPVEHRGSQGALSDYFREWSRELTSVADPFAWASQMDLLTYLPDDLMVKADRASMSVGLEVREPLLDHELTAWCLRCSVEARYDRRSKTSKLLPRRALERRLSRRLFDRPKQGFTPPLEKWLAGPLLPVVNDARERLSSGRLQPIVLPEGCKTWSQCAAGLRDRKKQFLWRVVCFSEWMKNLPGAV